MKNFIDNKYSLLLLTCAIILGSCNRHEEKNMSKANPSNSAVIVDTPKAQANTDTIVSATSPSGSNGVSPHDPTSDIKLLPTPSGLNPQISNPGAPMNSAPIGSVPNLRPEQLAEFHPRLTDFIMSKVQENDKNGEVQSVILFKNRKDTTRTFRSIIFDINERAAGKLIYEMSQMANKKQETKVVEGESITSHYLEINGMPAIKAYIPSKKVATLYVLVGDHRAVTFREHNVKSSDHVVEAAKTIDFRKLETLTRN